MEILQIETVSEGWTIADLLTVVSLIGGLLAIILGWVIKIEIRQTKHEARIEANSQMDEQRVTQIDGFINEVKKELTDIKQELHGINQYITGEKAVKEAQRNG